MSVARRGDSAVPPGLSNTRRRSPLICLGVGSVPASSDDVRRDHFTTEAASFLCLGPVKKGEPIEDRSSAGTFGCRGAGPLLRVPFQAGDYGRLRLAWPVLPLVAGSLAGLCVSWHVSALSFERSFAAMWACQGAACRLKSHPLEERGNRDGSGLEVSGFRRSCRLGRTPRGVMVTEPSPRGFRAFSAPLPSAV